MTSPDCRPLILLIDDMATNLQLLVSALKADYRLRTATGGLAGLELARLEDRPDLILLDVMMPDLSGIEVLAQLRADPATADIPVVFVSADASEQTQIDGIELGADDYLIKPVAFNILRAKVRNLLERKQLERQLRLAGQVMEHSGEAIMVTDAERRILQVNPAFSRLTGYSADEALGQDPHFLSAGHTTPDQYQEMWRDIDTRSYWHGELWDRHKDGSVYPKLLTITAVRDRRGAVERYIGIFRDISDQKAIENEIRHAAHHDPLTGLPNRLYLGIALERMLATARRDAQEVAVLFVDLDRFKPINDTFGHAVGDRLLIEVARRLGCCLRDSDLVARLGGDEFVAALAGREIGETARQVASHVYDTLSKPYSLCGETLETSPSIGISRYPRDGDNVETLIARADGAMYRVKSRGGRGIGFHEVTE